MSAERSRLEARLTTIQNRMNAAYEDKLDGKITEEFWQLKTSGWRMEEHQVKMAMDALASAETGDRALDAEKIFELANNAYLLYISKNSAEKAKVLRTLLSNYSVDAVSAMPTYRYPFDVIYERAKTEEWSALGVCRS